MTETITLNKVHWTQQDITNNQASVYIVHWTMWACGTRTEKMKNVDTWSQGEKLSKPDPEQLNQEGNK